MRLKITFFAFFAGFVANAQDLCFEDNHYIMGGFPNSIVSADFNNDGFPDLASTSIVSNIYNTVKIQLNAGDGTFFSLTGNSNFPVGAQPLNLVVADFNEDGELDIATCNSTGGSITALAGDGLGYFTPLETFTINSGQQYPKGLACADFNGDGHADLLAGGGNNKLMMFLGTGTGTFGTGTFTNLAADSGMHYVAAADLNGDGNPDAVTANYIANTISVLMGIGDGTFGTPFDIATGTAPRSITIADINGDEAEDILVANFESGTVSVLAGNGDGTFAEPEDYATNLPSSIAVADFNEDGYADLAVANNSGGDISAVTILKGSSDGTFTAALSLPSAIYATTVIAEDLDMDGKPDMALSNYNSGNDGQTNIAIFLNCQVTAGAGSFVIKAVKLYPNPASGQLHIQLPEGLEIEKAIFHNVLGQKVMEAGSETSWNISRLARGVHFITLVTRKGSATLKFVKE